MSNQEEKYRLVEAWKHNGIGMQQYAEQNGISYVTMQFWYKCYRFSAEAIRAYPFRCS